MSTFHSTGNDTEKVTKNLDPNNAKGHDMIDIRKYSKIYSPSCLICSNFTSDQKKTSFPYS